MLKPSPTPTPQDVDLWATSQGRLLVIVAGVVIVGLFVAGVRAWLRLRQHGSGGWGN